jgi:octanoyl-[GcvH]:protein N-octanoyltransferase
LSGRRIALLRDPVPGSAALDTAASREILDEVARGERPETLRLWSPADALAFSVVDRTLPGFPAAVSAARDAGFEPFLRLAGGHAAVYAREVLAFAWVIPAPDPRVGIALRFDEVAGLVAAALRALGVEARIGEVPGEYCPGSHSVNARGRVKLMGVGQRVVRGAAYVGGAIVTGGSDRLRGVLGPVYAALGLPFDPLALGSVEDERARTGPEEVAQALLEVLAGLHELEPGRLDPELLARAERTQARYAVA